MTNEQSDPVPDERQLAKRQLKASFSIPLAWLLLLNCLTVWVVLRIAWNHSFEAHIPSLAPHYRVDINSATFQELEVLPQVGLSLATKIIRHRETHGPFQDLDALLEVHGLGVRTLEQLRPMLVIRKQIGAEHAAASAASEPLFLP